MSTEHDIWLRQQTHSKRHEIKRRYIEISSIEDYESYMKWLDKIERVFQKKSMEKK